MIDAIKRRELDYWAHISDAKEDGFELGIEQGVNIGLEQGREKERIEMIHELYKNGVSIDIIAKSTHLSIEEIENILNK